MAKSSDQVAASIANTIQSTDRSVDVVKGPYFDLVIRPPSTEISTVGNEVERVGTLYSRMADQSNSLSASEIDALGRSFGVTRPTGTRARALMLFVVNSKPSSEIVIPSGTPVSTSDGLYIFTTTSTVRGIDSSSISAYFDAESGKYLIPVQAVAVAEGSGYNIAAYRVTRMLSTVSGVSGVHNPIASAGGTDPYTSNDYLSQIQSSFYGRDTGSISGLSIELRRRGVSSQMLFVDPSERDAFFRPALGSSLDVYLSDPEETAEDEITVSTGSPSIVLTNQPVLGVDSVYINGKLLNGSSWTVSYDMSASYGRSSRATTKVNIGSVSSSDVIRVRYRYSGSVARLQQSLDSQDIMGADLLPRLLRPLPVSVSAEVSCPIDLLSSVKSSLNYYVTRPFIDQIDPKEAFAYLKSSYSQLAQLKWLNFERLNSSGMNSIKVPAGLQPTFKSASDLSVTIARS